MNAIAETRNLPIAARLPYTPALADGFGVDNVRWQVLCDAVFPNATKLDSIVMALTYCKARGLDVFKRPVHIVPMWSSAAKGMIDTIWPGIAELRTTAMRTKQYAGISACEFGPAVTQEWAREGKAMVVRFPVWAQMTVSRILPNGEIGLFAGPKVYWIEAYATSGRDKPWPNDMWARRPQGQIEKCAEAAALRRAFPEELGNDYAAEEMEGHSIEGWRAPAPPAMESARQIENRPVDVASASGATKEGAAILPAAPSEQRKPPRPPSEAQPLPESRDESFDYAKHKADYEFDLAGAANAEEIEAIFDANVVMKIHLFDRTQGMELRAMRDARLADFDK